MSDDVVDLTVEGDTASPDAACWNDETLFFDEVKAKDTSPPQITDLSTQIQPPHVTVVAEQTKQQGKVQPRKRKRPVGKEHQTFSSRGHKVDPIRPPPVVGRQPEERPAKYPKPVAVRESKAAPPTQRPYHSHEEQQPEPKCPASNVKDPPRPIVPQQDRQQQRTGADSSSSSRISKVAEAPGRPQDANRHQKKSNKKHKQRHQDTRQQNHQQQQHTHQYRRGPPDPRQNHHEALHMRRMELERFAEAQAKRQRGLDAKEVILENRARELEDAKRCTSKPSVECGRMEGVDRLEATVAQLREKIKCMQQEKLAEVAAVAQSKEAPSNKADRAQTVPPEKGANEEQQKQSSVDPEPAKIEEITQWKKAAEAEIEASGAKSNEQIKQKLAEIRKERDSFNLHTASAKQELAALQKEGEASLARKTMTMHTEHAAFRTLCAAERTSLNGQKTQLDADLLSFQKMQRQKQEELSEQEDAVREQFRQVEWQKAEQLGRAAEWEALKAKINTAHQLREEELGRQEASLARVRLDSTKAIEEVKRERKARETEMDDFAEIKVKQQRRMEAWVVEIEGKSKRRSAALDKREASLIQQKEELDRRAAVLQRRSLDLKQLKKDVDELKKKGSMPPSVPDGAGPQRPPMDCDKKSGRTETSFSGTSVKQGGGTQSSSQGFVLIDDPDNNDDGPELPAHAQHQKQPPPEPSKRLVDENKFSSVLTNDEAEARQERMFQEAAKKMKKTKTARVVSSSGAFVQRTGMKISKPIPDIAAKYPDHWKWNEPYSCLGLPVNATQELVKSHFRLLARTYHPDKSRLAGTETKFNAVMAAYRKTTSGA